MFDDNKFYRFADLKRAGLVPDWPTLRRWQVKAGFPAGKLLGPNFRTWTGKELNDFLETRPHAPVAPRGVAKKRGRA